MANYFRKIDPYEVSLSGKAFMFSANATMTGNQTLSFQLKTGEVAPVVLSYFVSSSAEPLLVTAIEAPTVTDGTTPVPTYNLDRLSDRLAELVVFSDPTNISGGTTIYQDLVTAGKGAGAKSAEHPSWTLKRETSYIWQVAQLTNQSTRMAAGLVFAEYLGTLI